MIFTLISSRNCNRTGAGTYTSTPMSMPVLRGYADIDIGVGVLAFIFMLSFVIIIIEPICV